MPCTTRLLEHHRASLLILTPSLTLLQPHRAFARLTAASGTLSLLLPLQRTFPKISPGLPPSVPSRISSSIPYSESKALSNLLIFNYTFDSPTPHSIGSIVFDTFEYTIYLFILFDVLLHPKTATLSLWLLLYSQFLDKSCHVIDALHLSVE